MNRKIAKLTLSFPWYDGDATDKRYRVERVTDSVEYTPGQLLHPNEVRNLCASKAWTVTTVATP